MTMRKTATVFMMVSLLALGACSGKKVRPDAGQAGQPVAAASTSGAQSAGAGGDNGTTRVTVGDGAQAGAAGPGGALGSQRIVYFDYDSTDIRPEFVDVVAAHGRFLSSNAKVRVRLEGHTDERGSPEYNVGLGERRAQTVKRALLLQGVTEAQIATVSYGEERPAVAGSDETAYAKNRRVEIFYIN
jgi:peptidoglycan-associated lipoprotein